MITEYAILTLLHYAKLYKGVSLQMKNLSEETLLKKQLVQNATFASLSKFLVMQGLPAIFKYPQLSFFYRKKVT